MPPSGTTHVVSAARMLASTHLTASGSGFDHFQRNSPGGVSGHYKKGQRGPGGAGGSGGAPKPGRGRLHIPRLENSRGGCTPRSTRSIPPSQDPTGAVSLLSRWSQSELRSSQGGRFSANGLKMAASGRRAGHLQPMCPPSNPWGAEGAGIRFSRCFVPYFAIPRTIPACRPPAPHLSYFGGSCAFSGGT